MKMTKVEMNFNKLMSINVQLKRGQIENMVITEEIATEIKTKMKSFARIGNRSYSITNTSAMIEKQYCEMHYNINRGWTCITVSAKIMGDILIITKENGDTNKRTQQFFRIG